MSASRYRLRGVAPPRPRAAAIPAAIAGTIGALLAGGAAAARAAPLRDCTPTRGTIVAVDFAHWGGPIVRGCGVGSRSGYALLHAAGFTTAGDAHDGPGIVCRIGDAAFRHGTQYPTPSQQSCVQTPPTTAYWAYWVAPTGSGRWTYSPLGAMGDVPRRGEVELWIFGATNVAGSRGTAVPRFSPAALRAHAASRRRPRRATTATRTTATRTTTTRTSNASTTTGSHSATTTPTTHTTATAPARRASARRHTARTHGHRAATIPQPRRRAGRRRPAPRPRSADAGHARTPPTSTTGAAGAKIVAARPTSRRAAAGSATPLILGAALVLLLCAAGARAIRRRRREE
jgi:hypothetical protein